MSSKAVPDSRSASVQERSALRDAGEWLQAHDRVAAGALFALFVFVYLAPVLVGGGILSPASNLFQFAPWASAAPDGVTNHLNFMLGDVPMSHYPWNFIARDLIHDGVFPAWSQHAYAGTPFFANPQTVLLSPFSLPMWILPLDYGIGVTAALKLWFAAFGTYLLVRELRLGFWPGILAGVSYSMSAFAVLWLGHETLIGVALMLPWMVWLVERILSTGRLAPVFGLAIVTAVMITGGHPGAIVHTATAVVIFTLVRAVAIPDLQRNDRLRRLGYAFGGMALGALLLAVLIIPTTLAGDGTIGKEARIGENDTIPGAQLPFESIRTALFPDWWGRPSAVSLEGPPNYMERTFFAGSVATLFGLVALVTAGAWRRKAPFAVLAFIGLAVPLHFPGLYWLAKNLPLLEQVQHQRMMLLYIFSAAVLGAIGLQRILDEPRDRVRAWAVVGAAALVGVLALAAARPSGDDIRQAFENLLNFRHAPGELITGTDPNVAGRKATSAMTWIVVVAAVGALLAALWRWPRRMVAVAIAIVLVAAIDVQYFAHDFQPMGPRSRLHPPVTPAVEYLQARADEGRITGADGAILNNWPIIYGLHDVRGYDPPQPSKRWFNLWLLVNPDQFDWAQAMHTIPDQNGMRALSVMGARFLVTAPGVDVRAQLPQLELGYQGDDAIVWVNRDAVPRVMVPREVLLTSGEEAAVTTIAGEEFEPRRQVVVERGEPGADGLASSGPGPHGQAEIVEETNSTVTLQADMRSEGLVVLNDNLAPGWKVTVDGRPADAVRVNSVMRGVAVPAGEHEIRWSYTVPGLRAGMIVSGVALVILIGLGIVVLRHRRRLRPRSDA